ncbi:MAG TPA: hypothetical protein VLI71_09830 [Gammaproteobacteria bacterium]|nr:hypothetical protein [Gammaproteobacteria bacterium]
MSLEKDTDDLRHDLFWANGGNDPDDPGSPSRVTEAIEKHLTKIYERLNALEERLNRPENP